MCYFHQFRTKLGKVLHHLRVTAKESDSEGLLQFCNIAEECGISIKVLNRSLEVLGI